MQKHILKYKKVVVVGTWHYRWFVLRYFLYFLFSVFLYFNCNILLYFTRDMLFCFIWQTFSSFTTELYLNQTFIYSTSLKLEWIALMGLNNPTLFSTSTYNPTHHMTPKHFNFEVGYLHYLAKYFFPITKGLLLSSLVAGNVCYVLIG